MSREEEKDACISVDVETAGPAPTRYALLSIGACRVADPAQKFYVELRPDRPDVDAQALAVSGISFWELERNGLPPQQAMQQFADWLEEVLPENLQPIFAAFNAPFDWMFVNDYFHRYLGWNPFGHSALDIKAFYMGLKGTAWRETSFNKIGARYLDHEELVHNALEDAIDGAQILSALLSEKPGKIR